MSKKRQIKKNNDVVCAKFETSATNKQKNNDVIFAREHRKFKISVEDFDRTVQKIVTDFNSIYDFWYFCSNLHDSMILKFLLISYPLYWNLTKNILIWRRALLACVKNPSLNFYFLQSEQRWYYFLGLNTDKMGAKVLMCPCYTERFHHENHDYVKKLAIFIAIASMVTICMFVIVNNTRLLFLEPTIWSCTVRVQIFLIFALKLSICLILGPLRSVWTRCLRVFRSTLLNYQVILVVFLFGNPFLHIPQQEERQIFFW